jgi:DNA-binding transcriptional regulator YdaS (Cro superfamily)
MAKANDEDNGNALRRFFADNVDPTMNRLKFARKLGISHSYLSQLCSDRPPWPTRRVMQGITLLTKGAVRSEDLLRLPDPEPRVTRRKRAA